MLVLELELLTLLVLLLLEFRDDVLLLLLFADDVLLRLLLLLLDRLWLELDSLLTLVLLGLLMELSGGRLMMYLYQTTHTHCSFALFSAVINSIQFSAPTLRTTNPGESL